MKAFLETLFEETLEELGINEDSPFFADACKISTSNCNGFEVSIHKPLIHFILSIMSDKFRTLTITEAEETALVEIIKYFNDMGLPENVNFEDYDSLSDKVCEPAFWEYN